MLAEQGIEYVVLPAPADGDVASALDATGGLVQASAEDRATRAWQVDRPLAADAVDGPRLLVAGAAARRPGARGRRGRRALRPHRPAQEGHRMSQHAPGARSSSRRVRVDALAVLALLLPAAHRRRAAAGAAGRRPSAAPQAPTRTALTNATLVCPTALPGGRQALLGTAQRA